VDTGSVKNRYVVLDSSGRAIDLYDTLVNACAAAKMHFGERQTDYYVVTAFGEQECGYFGTHSELIFCEDYSLAPPDPIRPTPPGPVTWLGIVEIDGGKGRFTFDTARQGIAFLKRMAETFTSRSRTYATWELCRIAGGRVVCTMTKSNRSSASRRTASRQKQTRAR
jgi:hypothetical protein